MTTAPSPTTTDLVGPDALALPIFQKLRNKNVVLASSNKTRHAILGVYDFHPLVVAPTFPEDLPHAEFEGNLIGYPIATAREKALEVFLRLREEGNTPDLVIAADTVKIFPPELQPSCDPNENGNSDPSSKREEEQVKLKSVILEKPKTKEQQLDMLHLQNGKTSQIATGLAIVYPCQEEKGQGYRVRSISSSTLCEFYNNSEEIIQAYVASGEGMNHSGGVGTGGPGRLLINRIDGSWDNCDGFPSAEFWRWLMYWQAKGEFDAWQD